MPPVDPQLPRIRQAVLAAHDLDAVAGELSDALGLCQPFSDPGVEYFGLRNAVFALGDTFLEVVSPVRDDTAAGRLLSRRGGDCGYMIMFQVGDLAAARKRAAARQVREVFEIELDDIAEVHLHPADMRGAIVSLSSPRPPQSWRWAGPDWAERAAPLRVAGAQIAVSDTHEVGERWTSILGTSLSSAGVTLTPDESDRGLAEIAIAAADGGQRVPVEIGGVRFVFMQSEEDG